MENEDGRDEAVEGQQQEAEVVSGIEPAKGSGRGWLYLLIVLLGCAVVVLAVLLGLSSGSGPQSEGQYKKDWKAIIEAFQTRVNQDDKKATDLANKNDIPALITVINQRISNIDSVMGKILKLYPPPALRKLQALTLFYLTSVKDQFIAQNAVNDAALSGKPVEDLKKIADQAANQARAVGSELAVEIQKLGIQLKGTGGQQQPSTTPSSATQ